MQIEQGSARLNVTPHSRGGEGSLEDKTLKRPNQRGRNIETLLQNQRQEIYLYRLAYASFRH